MKYFVKFNYAAIRLALHMTTFLTLMSIMIIEIRLVKITCCKIQYCSYDYYARTCPQLKLQNFYHNYTLNLRFNSGPNLTKETPEQRPSTLI